MRLKEFAVKIIDEYGIYENPTKDSTIKNKRIVKKKADENADKQEKKTDVII